MPRDLPGYGAERALLYHNLCPGGVPWLRLLTRQTVTLDARDKLGDVAERALLHHDLRRTEWGTQQWHMQICSRLPTWS